MSRRWFVVLPVVLAFLGAYVIVQQAAAQTAVPDEAGQVFRPSLSTASDDSMSKLHPQLRQALAGATFDDLLPIMVSVDPENGVRKYMRDVLVRPMADPAGRQVILGKATANGVWKMAADPAVWQIQLASSLISPPVEETLVVNEVEITAEAAQARLQLMQTLTHNTRSTPPGRQEDLGRGWWDVGEGHHSAEAWANGYTGAGVKVMVNDSGVDFCHPDIISTWAIISDTSSPYDGWPEMFDSYSMYLYAQDVNLGTSNIVDGLADYADTSATCSLGNCSYAPIGSAGPYSFTLPPTSQSGVYHIGSHPDTKFEDWFGERIAVLVVDETASGVYDHVYVDLDYDFDFTDEVAADKQMPVACLDSWDSVGGVPGADGYNDVSGGLVYFIADGANPVPASDWLWGGLTPANGELVAFSIIDQTQSGGSHGQRVVSNIVAQGVINGNPPPVKPPYGGPGTGVVIGGGKDVAIVSNGNFYQTPFLDDAFLFAALGYDGVAGTADDIQIINNSWADSTIHNDGWDEASRLIEEALRLNPTLTAIFSTGNGGPGYGTVVSPVPASSLSVGSSTQFGSIGAFDSYTSTEQINWGDVIPFSNRGPGAQGTNTVDLTANGAVGSGDRPLHNTLDGWVAWQGWAGTSRSVPVAAGNLALVYDAYRQVHGVWPDTQTAQAMLMAGADDQHNDPFVQGAGLLNALNATNIAGGLDGFYTLPSSWTAGDYEGENHPAFANILHPGQSSTEVFSVTNTGPTPITVSLTSNQLVLSETVSFTFTTELWSVEDTNSQYRPDYVFDITNMIPPGTDLMEVRLVYPFSQFDPELNYGFNQRYRLQVLNWTDWNSDGNLWTDTNGNQVVNWGEIDPGEYMRFSYDYNTANVHQLRIKRPLEQMKDGIFLALRHISRSSTVPTTTMTFELNFYQHSAWDWLTFDSNSLTIGAGETAEFTASMTIPTNTNYGLYNGAIHMTGPTHNSVVPVVANVAADTNTFTIGGGPFTEGGGNVTPYINKEFYGNFNWAYLNESGDWRFFFMDAQPIANATSSLLIHDDWPDPIPNDIDTLIYGPTQDVYSANDPDYYGPYTLGFSGGSADAYFSNGRYFFNTATGTTEEWVAAPLEPGLHLIAQHNVLYSGLDTSLPFTKTVGTISLSPEPILIKACGPNGTVPVTFTNSIDLDSVSGAAFGLGMTEVYTSQPALQDDPMDPSTASFTQTLTITNGGRLEVQISSAEVSTWTNDLDLYLLYDADMSGTFDWGPEIVGASLSPGVDEMIRLDFPANGDYMIAVHGAQVPAPPFLFDLTVDAIQGTELFLSGVSGGPVGAGSELALDLDWNKVVQPGELWQGMVVIGTPYLPAALSAPVYVVPCDPTGVVAGADFSHNGPLVLGSTAVFTNNSTGTPPLSYLWDFGDGSGTTTAENPTHLYSAPGTYTVTLMTSNTFSIDTAEQAIYVGLVVTAGFEHNGPVGVGETAVFTNTSTGSEPLTYSWDFGDGGSSTAENPTHVYSAPGTYTVILTTTNPLGSDTFAGQIVVGAPAQAGFVDNGPIYVWETAVFTNTSTGSPPLTYMWDFGDGATSTAENPSHQYAAVGIYTVTLTVTNDFGSDVFMASIEVREAMLYLPAVRKP